MSRVKSKADWKPDVEFFQQALGFRIGNYGMTKWSDLFTNRQLIALTTFSDFVQKRARVSTARCFASRYA
jgi:putative DNA methylase